MSLKAEHLLWQPETFAGPKDGVGQRVVGYGTNARVIFGGCVRRLITDTIQKLKNSKTVNPDDRKVPNNPSQFPLHITEKTAAGYLSQQITLGSSAPSIITFYTHLPFVVRTDPGSNSGNPIR
jgi:hypothetical protein